MLARWRPPPSLCGAAGTGYDSDMAIAPEIMTELLEMPELDRADLAWRLIESLRDGSEPDDLDAAELEKLDRALDRSADDVTAGRTRPVAALLGELRARRAQ